MKDLHAFHTLIFDWFQKNGRVLPWREKINSKLPNKKSGVAVVRDATFATYFVSALRRDPYRIAVSELMLQQTQVDRVLPKFEAFILRWPTTSDLANATLSEVLIQWQGLGYNRRARFLHEMAKTVMQKHDGKFPTDEELLLSLPGIGEYTARAILTFAYGKDVGVIDTNVQRIFARVFYGVEQSEITTKAKISKKEFISIVDVAVPSGKGDPWNQALMDFGALVCTARGPKCGECPLHSICSANLAAQREGFKTYAEKLVKLQKDAPKKKATAKFQDTDRYFRGRIVDLLRGGPVEMEELWKHLEKNHGLVDRKRFGTLIEQLVLDKLIQIRGATVSLA
ncbi:MAG TPA: A/G-specific adenine glycosylase [Candidatus Saccharimonadia bacterium]|nr:A/G-specific adenine glycosylase [Candidatus Saccharimonadia bacterium]